MRGSWIAALLLALAALLPAPAAAQDFPKSTGRVTDAASIIPPEIEARLKLKLEALETQSQRQLVIATIPDLQGYDIADFGYQLGREWGIGDKERNDGALLIIAPKDRKLRIEVGYGL
ncbi:MAG: TPM domain-containing protein, partial [Sphingomonadaceae bacterium]|nr:TPM domain-containing protein [Sphingomonadaceae bacterium]